MTKSKQIKITSVCQICNKTYTITLRTFIKRAKNNKNIHICSYCSRIFLCCKTPADLLRHHGKIPWSDFVKYKNTYTSSKLYVHFKCSVCGQDGKCRWDHLTNRKYFPEEPICNKCIIHKTTSTAEWRLVNSKAQLIAQNRPDVIKKQKDAQKRIMKTEGELYIEKRINYKIRLTGYYNNIFFASSYELSFMYWANKHNIKFGRSCDIIKYYSHGKERRYFPDFWMKTGKKYLIEVKGFKNELVYDKKKAAIEYVKSAKNDYDEYLILDDAVIKNIKCWPSIKSIDKLKSLNMKEITINNFPKSWKKEAV